MNNLYSKGVHSFCFFERPMYFDLHYLANLAYTFADLFCVVFVYDKQTDILVMIFHHFCTIILIVFSLNQLLTILSGSNPLLYEMVEI